MITIKPHHFADIVKLYGAGIEHFIPDEAFQHDFYKIANKVIGNQDTLLQFTVYGDDICRPCNRFDGSRCTDSLDGIGGYHEKETYNRVLDRRFMELLELDVKEAYPVRRVLEILRSQKDIVFNVWLEEEPVLTKKRDELFQKGLDKLMANTSTDKNL